MATLADYYLPAQSAATMTDANFAIVRKEQFDGVRAMVSERRVAVGLSALAAWDWTAAGNRAVSASMVNDLRSSVEAAITLYLNTAIHTGGSITGLAYGTPTNWTKATLFAQQGIGDGSNWTNATGAYGSTLASNTERLALHLNEIILACQGLTHSTRTSGVSLVSGDSRGSSVYGEASCAAAQSAAASAWAGSSWASSSSGPRAQWTSVDEGSGTAFSATTGARRASYSATVPVASDIVIYSAWVPVSGATDPADCPYTADQTFQPFATASNATSCTSALIGDRTSMAFPSGMACPLTAEVRGWEGYGTLRVVYAPRFTLTS